MNTETQTIRDRCPAGSQAGFSLLELIVAMAIFTVVVGAIYGLLEVGRSDAFNTSQRTETMQNGRIALNTIGRDAINSGVGYWKSGGRVPDGTLERLLFLPADTDTLDDWLTPIVPGNGVRVIDVDGTDVATDAVTFVYQDNSFNDGRSLAVTAVDSTTNTLTVSPNNSKAASGDLYVYMIDDGGQPALGSLTSIPSVGGTTLVFGAGDPLQLNNPGGASTFRTLNASAACKRITWVTYFVTDNHVLVRRVYGKTAAIVGTGVEDGGIGGIVPEDGSTGGGVGFVEMPLAFGVEDFQVKYVMEDGTTVDDVVGYTDAGGTVIPANVVRQNIRLVKIEIDLRGSQEDVKTNQPVRVKLTGSFYTPNVVVPERPSGAGA